MFVIVICGMRVALSMTMLVLKQSQRAVLADKLPDAGNLAAGALLFGRFLSDRPFSLALALSGLGLWVVLVSGAVVLASSRGDV